MMLGFLLARAGVSVAVLEKHADFLRDFRGDTIHPSTLELMYELGLLEAFLRLPHQEMRHVDGQLGDRRLPVADLTRLPSHCRFLAIMPQWDFLNFLAAEGARYPKFTLLMKTEAKSLITAGERVTGLQAAAPDGPLDIRADLVVGADGRHSTIRAAAGFTVTQIGAPMDVLWFSLPRRESDGDPPLGRFDRGRIFIMISRGDHWQCGYVIAKGTIEQIRAQGLPAFRAAVGRLAPFIADRVTEIGDWEDVKLLTVAVDRLPRWYRDGLLCIGDAAHAMSPVGGVGINLAVQDAVAAANLLAAPLAQSRLATEDLRAVQRRREWPTRVTQRLQVMIQNRVISRVLDEKGALPMPLALRLAARFPWMRRLIGRVIGLGIRPEHVRTPGGEPRPRA